MSNRGKRIPLIDQTFDELLPGAQSTISKGCGPAEKIGNAAISDAVAVTTSNAGEISVIGDIGSIQSFAGN